MFSFIIDGQGGTYITQLSFQFACYFVGIIFLYIVTVFHVTNTNYFHEDTVIVPRHVEEDARVQGLVTDEDLEREHRKEEVAAAAATRTMSESKTAVVSE